MNSEINPSNGIDLTILGSGGCTVIPKPLCGCRICAQARENGVPYERTGPSAFVGGENLLIDTPAEIARQLNRSGIGQLDYLLFTHLDPDHVEGFRVVEQITLDFRTWRGYSEKQIQLLVPAPLYERLRDIRSIYGPLIDFYEVQGFIKTIPFDGKITVGRLRINAIPVDRGDQMAFVYVFEKEKRKLVYALCDIKPFPEDRAEVHEANLLVIQPGIFEKGLKHGFTYPKGHISRRTLYTFEETVALANRIHAERILFAHLEEYWNRSYDDYALIEKGFDKVCFAYDGMQLNV